MSATIRIQSSNLTLRTTEHAELDYVLELESSAVNMPYIIGWSREKHSAALQDTGIRHIILENDTRTKVGFMIVAGVESPHDCVEFTRIIIGEKGRGYGQEAIRLLKQWVFEELGAHRLWLDVKEHNLVARHLYDKAGFKEEGLLRDCLKTNGQYESLVIMSILWLLSCN
ncbi:GNAT family N-acetyltransferase [Paenibacillus sp. FSL K6-1230]|uniref:GNAT family N-acetyltransferase n=1 Tax=Paenibacillus sp. FSL K6-1230 TaxID=2921603 RepID=UPI0030FAFCC5